MNKHRPEQDVPLVPEPSQQPSESDAWVQCLRCHEHIKRTAAGSTNRKCKELVEISVVQVGRRGLTKVSVCLHAPAC
jgi:hypothetical protein